MKNYLNDKVKQNVSFAGIWVALICMIGMWGWETGWLRTASYLAVCILLAMSLRTFITSTVGLMFAGEE